MLALSLGSVLLACNIDNNVNDGDKTPSFDSGDPVELGGDTSSVDDTSGGDSGGTTQTGGTCADWSGDAAGGTLPTRSECNATTTGSPTWSFEPLWTFQDSNVAAAGLASVGSLNDDNGDGVADDDDVPDIVWAAWHGNVVAIDGATGEELWTANTSGSEQGIPAIGDLDGDGFPEVVISSLSWVKALHGTDGSEFWSGPGPTASKTECGGPGIADLDADGTPDVFHGRQVYDSLSGDVVAEGKYGHGTGMIGESPSSIAADVFQDGLQEVVVGNALYDKDADAVLTFGDTDGFPAVANFDDDDAGEIVSISSQTAHLYDDDGTEIWSYDHGSRSPSAPTVADFDGDGEPEVAFVAGGDVIALDTDGSLLWKTSVGEAVVYVSEISSADLDGDGDWEVLSGTKDGVTVLDGHDGTVLSSIPDSAMMCGTNPIFVDVDGDGRGEIVMSGSDEGLRVLTDEGGLAGALPRWTEGGWNITNVNEDMTVPTSPASNWTSNQNSFRAAPPPDAASPGVNLEPELVDICNAECGSGTLYVSWQLGNDGVTDLSGSVPVQIWGATDSGEQMLWSGSWDGSLASGELSASTTTVVTGVTGAVYDLWVVVDPDDDQSECDEADNRATWGLQVCE